MSDALSTLQQPFTAPQMGQPADDVAAHLAEENEAAAPDREHADLLKGWIESPNIAADLDEEKQREIAFRVKRDYDIDEESRADWKQKYQDWLKFAMQVAEAKTYPWPGASNVIFPLMTTAAVQFHARAYPAIVRDKNVVRGTVVGDDDGTPLVVNGQPQALPNGQPAFMTPPGAKRQRADRIGEHMSWQLLDEQEEWEPQTDRMLLVLPIVGTMFRKSYFAPDLQRNVSETVTADRLCVNYHAKSFETAPRKTEIIGLYPWEIEEKIRASVYLEEDYGRDNDAGQDEEALVTFLEQHRRWDLDDDGYPEPYIITVARDSGKLARIVAAYDMEGVQFNGRSHKVQKIEAVPYYTKYGFIPSPDNHVYDIGFGHLLFPINEAINTTLNQMFDAGHLANVGGGFIGSGLSMNTGAVRFQVGEYKTVNVLGGTLRENVLPLPFQGPNAVLFQLLVFLVEAGKEIAAVKDVLSGEAPQGANTPATTTLAIIEQGLKVFTAIQKRILRALKSEFKKLFRLNRLYLPLESGYQRGPDWKQVRQSDYAEGAGVEPVSDPTMITDMQRLGRAAYLGQFANDPLINQVELRRRMLDAAQIDNPSALIVTNPPPDPQAQATTAELQLQKMALDLQELQLRIRGAREAADLDIRRGKDKATEIESLSRAILNLAQAKKADAEADQQWYELQLQALRAQVEQLNAGIDASDASPATTANGGGNPAPAVPALASPPGQPAGAGVLS